MGVLVFDMSIRHTCGDVKWVVGCVSLEFRSKVWTMGRNLGVSCLWIGLITMRLGELTNRMSINTEEVPWGTQY